MAQYKKDGVLVHPPYEIDGRLVINASEEMLLAAGYELVTPDPQSVIRSISDISEFATAAQESGLWEDSDLLAEVKERKTMLINEYDSSSAVNSFSLAGQSMWLDAYTRQQLRTSIDAYQAQGAEQVTKWFGGQSFTFPVELWLTMLNALEVYAAEALNVTEAHKAAVMALTTIEEIEAYDHTTGYPEQLTLTPEWLSSHS